MPAAAASLEEADTKLFTLKPVRKSQRKSIRTLRAIVVRQARHEGWHEEFKRRIKTETVLPSAETAAMLFWTLLASGQIAMRKGDVAKPQRKAIRSDH